MDLQIRSETEEEEEEKKDSDATEVRGKRMDGEMQGICRREKGFGEGGCKLHE